MGKKEEARATIKGRLEFEDLERAKVFYTMRLFKEAVEKAHHLQKGELTKGEIVKSLYFTKYLSRRKRKDFYTTYQWFKYPR